MIAPRLAGISSKIASRRLGYRSGSSSTPMMEPMRRKTRNALSSDTKVLSSGFMSGVPSLLIHPFRRFFLVFDFRPAVSSDSFREPAGAQPEKPDETGKERNAAIALKIRDKVVVAKSF